MKWLKINESNRPTMVNEGPGAGYTVKISGFDVVSVKQGASEECYIDFTATIAPGNVTVSAYDYYGYGCDKTEVYIDGGQIRGYFYPDNCTIKDVDDELKNNFGKFESMVGGGWSHQNLSDEQTYDINENIGLYGDIYIETITIKSPELADTVNYSFENADDEDEDQDVDDDL